MKKPWRWISMCVIVFCLQVELLQQNESRLTYSIPSVLTDNTISTEEVNFDELSFDIVEEKIAVNPHYIYTDEPKTIYALDDNTIVFDRPETEKQQELFKISKRDALESLGYNSFNETYKIKGSNNEIFYVKANEFLADLNLIFDKAEGTFFLNDDKINLRNYPSNEAESITTLDVNTKIELLLKNSKGYCKIKVNDYEGFIHEDYLSESKVNYISPMQQKVADLAIKSITKNQGTTAPIANLCAGWVSGLYEAAGIKRPNVHAIDFWVRWSSSGSSSMENIPIGAVVVGSGSNNPNGGRIYGHCGIYVGDTNGDGEGEVVDNIGGIAHWELSEWISWQKTPVYHYSSGKVYDSGFIGWVWPNGEPLGTGI